jgi:hypothetical protein
MAKLRKLHAKATKRESGRTRGTSARRPATRGTRD